MITKREKNKIKKVLGNNYCDAISKYLFTNDIRNLHGKPHSDTMITNVMNGKKHKKLEDAIFKVVVVVVEKNLESLQEGERRKEILSKKKYCGDN